MPETRYTNTITPLPPVEYDPILVAIFEAMTPDERRELLRLAREQELVGQLVEDDDS